MANLLPRGKKLSAERRLKLVLQVIKKNKSVSHVCRRAGISRSFFYRLKKQYFQAGRTRQEKIKALEPKTEWTRRGRQVSKNQIREVIKVILKNPEYGIARILWQIYANNRRRVVSRNGTQALLFKLGLNTIRKRRAFSKWARRLAKGEVLEIILLSLARRYKDKPSLSPEKRLKALRLVDDGIPVAQICRNFRITRKNFYKWQGRYYQSAPGKEYRAVTNRKPEIKHYWRQAADKQVEAVLKIVAKHPSYSTQKVSATLPKTAGKPILGNHGVQNVFRRLGLNTYEKRLVYARTHPPAVSPVIRVPEWLKPILASGRIPIISAIPPPVRAKIIPLFLPFVFSFFLSIIFSALFIYWLRMIDQAPTLGAKLGLIFASVAFLIGGLFFTYSTKYYLTLAIVLSFSRQPLEGNLAVGLNGRVNGGKLNGNGGNGNGDWGDWLRRIFGLLNGNGKLTLRVHGHEASTGSLQPNLEHIELKRYPFFSIHLPFYNEKKVAERIISACMTMDYPKGKGNRPNFEIIACDDSTDQTTKIIRAYQKKLGKVKKYRGEDGERIFVVKPRGKPILKIIHRKTRQGFKGGALSYALKHMDSRTEFVCVFDADFVPYPDTLQQFLKYFKAAGGWRERLEFKAGKIRSLPYETNKKLIIDNENLFDKQLVKLRKKSNIAVVTGYQWHVLNKSENWITRGVRTEYSGSYVIERSGREILGALKIIHGSAYCARADVLKHFGWGTSITEDFELTLRIYEQGFKVAYTPYLQAPAECVSTLGRLIKQRMRWAEGHSNNIRKMAVKLLFSPNLTLMEKVEVLYSSPYYLQAFFFLIGTLAWLISEIAFRARLPFWTSLWGWSLVLTNFLALPLVNGVGLFLEESGEKDYLGLLSFIGLSYLLVPFQAYASIKGFLEKEEGPWFRTPKTGRITDIFTRGRFYRWISGIIPRRRVAPVYAEVKMGRLAINPYLALTTANNRFNSNKIPFLPKRRMKWVWKVTLAITLAISTTVFISARNVSEVYAAPDVYYLSDDLADGANGYPNDTDSWRLITTAPDESNTACSAVSPGASPSVRWLKTGSGGIIQFLPIVCSNTDATLYNGQGWYSIQQTGQYPSGTWTFNLRTVTDTNATGNWGINVRVMIYDSDGSTFTPQFTTSPDRNGLDCDQGGADDNDSQTYSTTEWTISWSCTAPLLDLTTTTKSLYIDVFANASGAPSAHSVQTLFTERSDLADADRSKITTTTFGIPENLRLLLPLIPFVPLMAYFLRKRNGNQADFVYEL